MTPQQAAYGASLRQARSQRVRMIRRRVIAGALALFVAVWLFITLMLVTGHDPALAKQTASTATTAAKTTSTTTPATTSSTASSPSTTSSTTASGSSSSGSSGTTSSVTSSQS